jgi:hypothetical protein
MEGMNFTLFDWTLLHADSNYTLDLPDISSFNLSWDTSTFASTGSISVIPEPNRSALLLLSLITLLRTRRRSRQV